MTSRSYTLHYNVYHCLNCKHSFVVTDEQFIFLYNLIRPNSEFSSTCRIMNYISRCCVNPDFNFYTGGTKDLKPIQFNFKSKFIDKGKLVALVL